jgi:hypothetical protein
LIDKPNLLLHSKGDPEGVADVGALGWVGFEDAKSDAFCNARRDADGSIYIDAFCGYDAPLSPGAARMIGAALVTWATAAENEEDGK